MAKNLVIVESPAKAKTIGKFLGSNYEVIASMGHVRDLPKSQLGVDVGHDFEPKYITIRGKGELINKLKKEAAKVDHVYLATDPDREGEAISWHLAHLLDLPLDKPNRVTFNEITKETVKSSIKKPRRIDLALVDAQQARRVLDRLVGYKISPVLWKKVRKGLSAGRVQSTALKLLCDRENEIADFEPREYWTIEAVFLKEKAKGFLKAKLSRIGGRKAEIGCEEDSRALCAQIRSSEPFAVTEIRTGKRTRKAPLPFTTSTLQQEASHRLGFPPQKTMQVAQQLYEGVDIGGGSVGLITYLRTDSVRIAQEAKDAARQWITQNYGLQFAGSEGSAAGSGKRIQDAHEAIRPTYVTNAPASIEKSLTRDQYRLYKLIYERFLASQMAPAIYDTLQITLAAKEFEFQSNGSRLSFPGFLKVYKETDEEKDQYDTIEGLAVGDTLRIRDLTDEQHFTQPPARYSEATLIRALEENGVGRPSTYAPIVGTLTARNYITKEKKLLYVTELGQVVNQLMVQSFEDIVDIGFTARMESQLDAIEEGSTGWTRVMEEFYGRFSPLVEKAERELEKVKIADEVTDVICEKCGRNMVLKTGRYGKFYACPGFPECRNAKPFVQAIEAPCPTCGARLIIRRSRKGRIFYGCENYPKCEFTSWNKPVTQKCPKCGSYMVESKGRKLRYVCADSACGYAVDAKEEKES